MIPLSQDGAKYFCKGFSGSSRALDMEELYENVFSRKDSFKEGEAFYLQYRDSLLRESDRSFFLAVSCFRRSLELFMASAAFWIQVSLYYSSWYAARSTLGMLGCWVHGPRRRQKILIEVNRTEPGSQEFLVNKNYQTHYSGSHRVFWDAYYRAMQKVSMWADPKLVLAVDPINNDPTWAIDHRNLVNYRSLQSFKLMEDYSSGFDSKKISTTLPKELAQQFQVTKSMLLFSAKCASDFGLTTDTFSRFPSRAIAIRDLIYKTSPVSLSNFSEEQQLTV